VAGIRYRISETTGLTVGLTENFPPQSDDIPGFRFAPLRPIQRRQQTLCIPWRSQQVSRLDQ
jgi:hypothetical protein